MAAKPGFWIAVGGGRKAEKIQESIETQDKFTTVVTASEVSPKAADLCIVSLDGESADYLGISQAPYLVATDEKRIAVTQLIDLGAVDISQLRSRLPKRVASRFKVPTTGAARLSPKLWEAVLDGICALRPRVAKAIAGHRKQVSAVQLSQLPSLSPIEVFERDAVGQALQIWGGDRYRKRLLRTAKRNKDRSPAPFLKRLTDPTVREDIQINHDASSFPGMEVAARHQVGSVVLENDRGEQLTIINCNRQPLEETLGVDLIYYNHSYDSFVLVQYKRMTKESEGKIAYRPNSDPNYESEMDRMRALVDKLDGATDSPSDGLAGFRLSAAPCFFKFCQPKVKGALDEGLVSGLYVPFHLWERFVASNESKGARGGLLVNWDNCRRRFSNSEFTELLRAGWIGSAAGQSKMLSDIVEAVLDGKRMLVYAASSAGIRKGEYLRDSFGRFSSEDDPLSTL